MLLPRHLAQHLEDSHRLLVLGHGRLYCSLPPWRSRPWSSCTPSGGRRAERLHQRFLAADTLAVLEAFSDRFRHGERPDSERSTHG